MYKQFVEPTFGRIKLSDIKRSDVRSFYNRLKEDQGLMVSTINCVHTVLHQVLELAVDDEYIRFNPSDNALKELKAAYRNESPKKKAMTIEEQVLFEEYLSNSDEYKKWYQIFIVMLWTGMRVVKVKNCEEVPKSKKLLIFTLDDGSEKERVILSGIKEYYSAGSLIGKTLLAITNLPPRKMMGNDSEGMIISAICEYDGKELLNLIMLDKNIPAGSKIY